MSHERDGIFCPRCGRCPATLHDGTYNVDMSREHSGTSYPAQRRCCLPAPFLLLPPTRQNLQEDAYHMNTVERPVIVDEDVPPPPTGRKL